VGVVVGVGVWLGFVFVVGLWCGGLWGGGGGGGGGAARGGGRGVNGSLGACR